MAGPKLVTSKSCLGNLDVTFKVEKLEDLPMLDTKVEVTKECLCWITWTDKDKFIEELNEVIAKYRI